MPDMISKNPIKLRRRLGIPMVLFVFVCFVFKCAKQSRLFGFLCCFVFAVDMFAAATSHCSESSLQH